MASITDADNARETWLYNRATRSRTTIRKESYTSIGDVQGVVIAMVPTCVQIRRGKEIWELPIGKDLRSMTRIGEDSDETLMSE